MKYNNRLYPYPVLGIEDDINGSMEVDLKYSSDAKVIKLSPTYRLVNEDLNQLIKEGKAFYVAHIYCRGTMYRDVLISDSSLPGVYEIDAHKLNGDVEIDFFICCNKTMNYSNSDCHTDFKDYKFTVEKADILAYAGKGKFYANKVFEDLKAVSALMVIDNSQESNKPMYNVYNSDKITVLLCKEDYERYQIIKSKGGSVYTNILHSCVVVPALVEALYYLDDTDLSNEYVDKRWHIVLSEIKDKSHDTNYLKMAQNILQMPNNRLFDSLIKSMEDYE